MLKLSLIIPVYNEERHIKACFDAITNQTIKPHEVILVDNNCIDSTVEIAKQYDFVTIIKEPKQGLIAARNTGFKHAKGDILGRIDADSEIDSDWVKNVIQHFESDKELFGLTGYAYTDFLPYVERYKSTLFSRVYFWCAKASFRTQVMWGANMAFRSKTWPQVKNMTSANDKGVHEDQDLSICVASLGHKIEIKGDVLITTSGQTYGYLPKLLYYSGLQLKTRKRHRLNGNLSNSKIKKVGLFTTLPGVILGAIPVLYIFSLSIIRFPLDLVLYKFAKRRL